MEAAEAAVVAVAVAVAVGAWLLRRCLQYLQHLPLVAWAVAWAVAAVAAGCNIRSARWPVVSQARR